MLQGRGYQTSLIGKYLNGYGQQPIRGTHTSSLHYVPPGLDDVDGASDHEWRPGDPFHGSTYNYFNLVQNINGRIVGFPGPYTTDVMAREARQVVSGFASKPAPWFVWWTPVAPHFGKPYEPDDPLPTPSRPRRVPTGSRAGSTPRSPTGWVRRRTAAPRPTSATSRSGCASSTTYSARPGVERRSPVSAPRHCSCSTCRSAGRWRR